MADMDVGTQLAQLPVGSMVEGMGLAIAKAQTALDENTVLSLKKLAETTLTIGDTQKSLIEFGLVPSFYHFTEATLDLKFSMSMSTEETKKVKLGAGGAWGGKGKGPEGGGESQNDPKKKELEDDIKQLESEIKELEAVEENQRDKETIGKKKAEKKKKEEELNKLNKPKENDSPAEPAKKDKEQPKEEKSTSGLAVGASLNFENSRKYGFSAEGSTHMNLKLVAVPPPAALMAAIQPATA